MKIIITGTHGIPNRYGGFEAFAEQISVRFTLRGHKVAVYTPESHPWKENHFQGVQLIRKPFHSWLGPLATLDFDRRCFADVKTRRPDIILNCGTPGALFFNPTKFPPVVTLTDGLEWQRKKWSSAGKGFLRLTEKKAVKNSRVLISDHPLMVKYFSAHYGKKPHYIPYGATLPSQRSTKEEFTAALNSRFGYDDLIPGNYFLTIARIEPENNISMIIEGYLKSGMDLPLIIVGNIRNRYGRHLVKLYRRNPSVRFVNGIYDTNLLYALRYYSRGYIHGHSVGGTNPSLLEAMAAGCMIIAHDNPFNRYILGKSSPGFNDAVTLSDILKNWDHYQRMHPPPGKEHIKKIDAQYQWDQITDLYLEVFERIKY